MFAKGVFIYLSTSLFTSYYKITNCVFQDIRTPRFRSLDPHYKTNTADLLGFGLGGGLSIVFSGNTANNTVSVINYTFRHNIAPWGAGISVSFHKHSAYNSVFLRSLIFFNCQANVAGGGMIVGSVKRSPHQNKNVLWVISTFFKDNSAEYGAGTHIFALPSNYKTKRGEFVNFRNCSWINNRARYSPAVDISPSRFDQNSDGALPIPVFQDCKFAGNSIYLLKRSLTRYISFGVFVISRFTVSFSGTFYFDSNIYTALLLNSGKIVIEESTHNRFVNNTGFQGGAVAMNGYASLSKTNNCLIEFINNRATEFGGAIFYYPIEQREIFRGRVCFIQYTGNQLSRVDERNISFVFDGNTAFISGSSIYSTSLSSCYFTYQGTLKNHSVCDLFNEIGNFTFDRMAACASTCSNASAVPILGTAGHHFITGVRQLISLPGKNLSLPFSVRDELGQDVKSDFFARVSGSNTSIHLGSPYTVNRAVTVYGTPNDSASLVISTQDTYH